MASTPPLVPNGGPDLVHVRADAVASIVAAVASVPGIDETYWGVLKDVVEKHVDTVLYAGLESAYIVARGTHKLDKLPKVQQYWRGRAQAGADVRLLESRLRALR